MAREDDFKPTDGYGLLHESQTIERFTELHDDQQDLDSTETTGTTRKKSAAKQARENELRKSQGNRTDYRQHILENLPRGYRLIPDTRLSFATKMARTLSLKAAAAKRGKRDGITIHYDQFAWKKLGQARRDEFDAIKPRLVEMTGRTWDFNADFRWYNGDRDGVEHLDCLFRSGSPGVHAQQPFRQHHRETGGCLDGWHG